MADAWSFLFSFFSFLFLNKMEERKTDSGRFSLQSPHGYFFFLISPFPIYVHQPLSHSSLTLLYP